MGKSESARMVWAVETMGIQPGDRVLEIGCGHGVAVSLVCERLDGGRITAIDRSEKMIEMAGKRNRECVAAGKAVLQATTLEDAQFDDGGFDKVFAINVSVFWQQPGRSLAVVRRALVQDGVFYVFYQPPSWDDEVQIRDFGARVSEVLSSNGFAVEQVLAGELSPAMVCVIAR